MPKRNMNEMAKSIVDRVAGEDQDLGGKEIEASVNGKNQAAVALGRLGGLKGGRSRAKELSAERRSEIARKAAEARWKRVKGK